MSYPSPDDFEGWYVVQTKPHAEARVLEELEHRGIGAYCPMVWVTIKRNRRDVLEPRPMLVRYVFAYLKVKGDFHTIKHTRGVSSFLMVGLSHARIRDRDLDVLREVEAAERDEGLREHKRIICPPGSVVATFEDGQRVKITDGPMKGLEGVVDKGGEARTFRILAVFFNQQTPVDVDAAMIEAIIAEESGEGGGQAEAA